MRPFLRHHWAYYALAVLTALNTINLWHRYLIVSRCAGLPVVLCYLLLAALRNKSLFVFKRKLASSRPSFAIARKVVDTTCRALSSGPVSLCCALKMAHTATNAYIVVSSPKADTEAMRMCRRGVIGSSTRSWCSWLPGQCGCLHHRRSTPNDAGETVAFAWFLLWLPALRGKGYSFA